MHALHLSTWHPFIDGVSGTFVLEQCAALRDAGTDVGLVFARIEGLRSLSPGRLLRARPGFVRLDSPVPTFGFKTFNIPGSRRAHRFLCEWALRNRYQAYARAIGKPDLLHAHVALEAGAAARRIAKEMRLEYVVTEHSSEILNGVKDARRKAAARKVYEGARSVIAVSDLLAERISDICPTAPIRVIPNLVRDSVFELGRATVQNVGKLVVVSIGGLVPGKRTQDAIAAIGGLPDTLKPRVEYHIVGEGPENKRLKTLAHERGVRTQFHGALPHHDAMQLLSGADLLVHPSGYETFGLAIAEGLALGIPVVATRCGGPESFVISKVGRLVAVGDVSAMRESIREILESRKDWSLQRGAIANIARRRFHETVVAAAISEEYQ